MIDSAGDDPLQTSTLSKPSSWLFEAEVGLLLLLVIGLYSARLTALPVHGEESRWARGAVLMLETGDWLVPRQQRQVFPERPPLSSWAIALTGAVRGKVDLWAIRLPSVLGVLLTALLIYGYARTMTTRFGALAAAIVYATMGQVLQLGRRGESEALFTLFVSGSLLTWHWGYVRRRRSLSLWALPYALAALGALVKGLQAPIYFGATTFVFLAIRRDWKTLFSWSHAAALLLFAVIVGAWAIPFYLATDTESFFAIWAGLAVDRLLMSGLVKHLVTYPLEIFGCLLPWSFLLFELPRKRFRESLNEAGGHVQYLLVAIAVTFPSVWLVAGARGRYYMPLFPCFAILIGLVIQRCIRVDADPAARRGWQLFLTGLAATVLLAGIVFPAAPFVPLQPAAGLIQPTWFGLSLLCVAVITAALLLWSRRWTTPRNATIAILSFGIFFGLFNDGALVNTRLNGSHDPGSSIAELKAALPHADRLVSFGPISHRFAYFYEMTITELPWPTTANEVPAEVEYFCFDRHSDDTAAVRMNGRGRTWSQTPGQLPFEWEQVDAIGCDRSRKKDFNRTVVVGRIIKPRMAAAETRSLGQ
jgi:4-amino-4-deoxy-L-arabinose transferase-like glycosyltransferase